MSGAQQTATRPAQSLPSGSPAVASTVPKPIVVGEKAEKPLQALTYVSGQQSETRLMTSSGLLRKLRNIFTGTMTVVLGGGTAAWNTAGVFGVLGQPFLGTTEDSPVVAVSAYMQWIINMCRKRDYDPISVFLSNATTAPYIYSQPAVAAGGAFTVAVFFEMFPELDPAAFVGLINLQEMGMAKLGLTMKPWGRESDGIALTGAATATFVGTLGVQQCVYEVPLINPDTQQLPPLNLIHRFRTKKVAINFVGADIEIPLDAGPTYIRFYIRSVLNAIQNSLDLNYIKYQYGLGKAQIQRDLRQQLAYQRDYLERDLPTGLFVIAFDPSDVVRSLDVAAPTLVLNYLSTATLGTGNNYLEIVSEEVVPLT